MNNSIELTPIGLFDTGIFDDGAAEIPAFDAVSQRLFVTNGANDTIDALDLSDPSNPTLAFAIDITPFGGGVNSVAVSDGILAAAIESDPATELGSVVFFDSDGNLLNQVTAGSLPDQVTFSPDGTKVLVANEGEADEDDPSINPPGSVSIVDIADGLDNATVATASFEAFDGQEAELQSRGIRIFPDVSVSEDVEPEFITVSGDSSTAFVALQENNAIAVVDIESSEVVELQPLGAIDFSSVAIDASDVNGIEIVNQPVFGLFQPDSIDSYEVDGETFIVTANEGDSRDEEVDVVDIELDPEAFPNAAELQTPEEIGNLEVSSIDGDLDGDGDFDQLFAYGSRSFSIRDSKGNIVFDSGDDFERITAELVPEIFNSNGDVESFDERSNDSGPEPEGLVVGEIEGRTFAFIGLERTGGIMVYDVTVPAESKFVQYINPLDAETGDAENIAPEGLAFISAEDSPNGSPLLAVANEISGTTSIFEINADALGDADDGESDSDDDEMEMDGDDMNGDGTFTLQLFHAADQEAGLDALVDAPNFSAVLDALRAEDLDGDGEAGFANTLTLSSGDAYIPSPFFSASDDVFGDFGRGDIIIQNELGFQAIAFGNHEFDLGTGEIEDLIEADEEDDYPGTQFPYLSSNLDFSGDDNLAGFVVEDGQEASEIPNSIAGNTIITLEGEQIGVVGATTPTLDDISSPTDVTISPIEFDSNNPDDVAALAAEIQESVDSLLVDNPDLNKVILLAHMQLISVEEQLSELLTDVDIIVAGGSNTILTDETDALRAGDESAGAYPILNTAADGNPIAVVNTDGNYRYVGRLVVDFDENGVIIPESIDPEISGAFATDEAGVAAVGGTPNPKVVEVTDAISAVIAEQGGNTFGNTDVFLNGQRVDIRSEETNFGNLAADANLEFAQSIDPEVTISIRNGGGIRDSIGEVVTPAGSTSVDDVEFLPPPANEIAGTEEGEISQLDIANSLSFNNGITLVTVTAEELLALIENGVSESEPGAEPGRFPQVSGIAFSFDASLPPGERVVSLATTDNEGNVTDVVVENGEVVGDPTRTFRTVTLDFLADGGDDFPFPDTERVDLIAEDDSPTGVATFAPDGSEQDVLAEFIAENFSETPFDIADTPVEEDIRIQNLAFREDTVLLSTDDMGDGGTDGMDNMDGEMPDGDDGDDSGEDAGFAPLFGTTDGDQIEISGSDQLVFAGDGDDLIDALTGGGGNRIYGGNGNDIVILGEGDRIFGEAGDDLFFATSGGDNLITGGAGADQFWIATATIPESTNTVDDFTAGEDVIGIAGLGIGFDDLSLTQIEDNALIATGDSELATLVGVDSASLTADNFAFG
ncbi:MAG: choice-of-anchor I family protein [Cyanobacteria bacterium P01_G01_bin.67]